jgi:hypothetical protein
MAVNTQQKRAAVITWRTPRRGLPLPNSSITRDDRYRLLWVYPLSIQFSSTLAGALSSSGTLAASSIVLKLLTGTLTSAGALTRQSARAIAGTLTSAGDAVSQRMRILSGTLTSGGEISKSVFRRLLATLAMAGTIAPVIITTVTDLVVWLVGIFKTDRDIGGSV